MLKSAEERYGVRSTQHVFLGIEFWKEQRAPQIIHSKIYLQGYSIRLAPKCLIDDCEACWQLAHEVVHSLYPVHGSASVLEEGAAVDFALGYIQQHHSGREVALKDSLPPYYREALQVFRQLEGSCSDWIRDYRKEQPSISSFTVEGILARCPRASRELAERAVVRM